MSRSSLITLLVIVGILIGAGAYAALTTGLFGGEADDSAANQVLTRSSEGAESPYRDLNGDPVELSDFNGQVRVVNSWASWCPFCVEELPDLDRLAAEYADDDVVVIAINRQESATRAERFLNSISPLEHTLILLDRSDRFYEGIGGFTMPETVFYDTAGNVVVHKRGFMELPEMREHTETALSATNE